MQGAGSAYGAERHTFPLQPDLVREAGSSWWQAGLGAPLCPQPPASCLSLTAGPGCSRGLRWSTSRLWKQTGHVCSHHIRTRSMLLNTRLQKADRLLRGHQQSMWSSAVNWTWSKDCSFHTGLLRTVYKGVFTSIWAFELRLNIPGSAGAVWHWHSMEANWVKGTEDSFVVAMLAVLHTHRQNGCWRISWGGIRLLSREGKHQIPCSYRQCLKCKWAVSARSSVVDPLLCRKKTAIFLWDCWTTFVPAISAL